MSKELESFSKKVYDRFSALSPDNVSFDIILIGLICSVVIDIIKIIYMIYFTKDTEKVYNYMKSPKGLLRLFMARQIKRRIPNLSRSQRDMVLVAIINEVRAYGYDEFKTLVSSIEKEQ